jgi:uncharacterized protein YbaR (Trm112 family)
MKSLKKTKSCSTSTIPELPEWPKGGCCLAGVKWDAEAQSLTCNKCGTAYRPRDGVPCPLPSAARAPVARILSGSSRLSVYADSERGQFNISAHEKDGTLSYSENYAVDSARLKSSLCNFVLALIGEGKL